jgi:hypothetical protein
MGNRGNQLSGVTIRPTVLLLSLLVGTAPAIAADCPTGVFIATAGPDTASALEIDPSGQFRYMFSEGAVDEAAEGRWQCVEGALLLSTQPSPKPPEFHLADITDNAEAPFSLLVTWPDGQGIPAVDFKLSFDDGETISDYTQSDGWSRDLGGRRPRSVQVFEPFFGTISPVIPLPDRDHIRVNIVLTPNDMGVADFRETRVTNEDGRLILHWRDRAIPYAASRDD